VSSADRRAALHIATGGLALSLRFLPASAAVALAVALVLHNRLVFPRTLPSMLRTPPRADAGLLSYPLGVLAAVLLFHDRLPLAAAVWGILAAGDGAASLVGRRSTRPLPWNPDKRWAGTAAFTVCGTAAGGALLWFTAAGKWSAAAAFGMAAAAAVAGALAESWRSRVDDNVRVVAFTAGVLALAPLWAAALRDGPEVAARAPWVLAASVVLAAAAWRLGTVDLPGAVVGIGLATAIGGGAGWGAMAALLTFYVLANAATRAGRRGKDARGIAQARGGRRGSAHALANLGVAAALALAAGGSVDGGLLRIAVSAALATAAFDTVASEAGQAWGSGTRSPITGRAVPPGTPGGMSVAGTLAGVAAAAGVAWVAGACGLHAPAAAWVVTAGAAAGGIAESFVGASPLRGALDGHARNFLNTATGAALAWSLGRWAGS
jgi:uncharacterized protein (TIGR00297 family)